MDAYQQCLCCAWRIKMDIFGSFDRYLPFNRLLRIVPFEHFRDTTSHSTLQRCIPSQEEDGSTQTDEWMDLPQLPLFIPTKTGDDKSTQIEEGDLFDFDLEVRTLPHLYTPFVVQMFSLYVALLGFRSWPMILLLYGCIRFHLCVISFQHLH